MDQVFTYSKTFQDRLQEFLNILGGTKLHSVSDIKKEWSVYLELTMDPNGWQAIWRIPRLMCEELNVEYPTQVLVYVDIIDFKELTASVCVLAVQIDAVIPNRCDVPLIQLSITKEQDDTVGLNLEATANCLDMLTFFYTHVIMPWDYHDDDISDWLDKHLESRLRLYYDMNHNLLPKSKIEQLQNFLTKARRLHSYRMKLELEVDENGDDIEIEKLLDIFVSLVLIRSEVELLANPLFRNVNFYNNLDDIHSQKLNTSPANWIVFKSSDTIDEQLAMLNIIKDVIDSDSDIRPVYSLMQALQSVSSKDVIWLNKGDYKISESPFLPEGVTIKSLDSPDETVLTAHNDDILLNCSGALMLENITLDVKTSQCGLVVHSGLVTLKNCKILGDGKSSTHRGIIVLTGSELNMIDCCVSDFYAAIVGYTLSSVMLRNCKVERVNQGLKVFNKCNVDAKHVVFSNCKDYGIWVETKELDCDTLNHGNFSILEIFPEIKLENVTAMNIGKYDAIIVQKSKLKPITDLFSNPDLDPTTIHDESNDEMNVSVSNEL